jgi:hypothetical protein
LQRGQLPRRESVSRRPGRIYLREDTGLIALVETPYEAESLLQELLADYPDLLAGDQMRPSQPRRWLLISREASIPDEQDGAGRWSLDHLFIDQDAVPTLVEVKRSSDTRIRREVLGQMLDYAANLVAYWPVSRLRETFEARSDPETADGSVLELIGGATGETEANAIIDDFWARADANLTSRRLRLVFVADVIPPELQRIVEFLNESLLRVEVFAIEVKQFVGAGRQTLVSRVIGQTAAAEDLKASATGRANREWTLPSFIAEAAAIGGSEAEALVRDSVGWTEVNAGEPSLGKGKYGPVYLEASDRLGRRVKIANVNAQGSIMILYISLADTPPFDEESRRLDLHRRLTAVPGVSLSEKSARDKGWPSIPLGALANNEARRQFFEVMDWVAAQLGSPDRI